MGVQGRPQLAEKKDFVSLIVGNLIEYGLQVVLAKHNAEMIIMILVFAAL
jgi:hypothetical protein